MSMILSRLLPERRFPPAVAQLAVDELQLDSRRLARGHLFLALAGGAADGRAYIRAAIEAGAAAVLSESEREGLDHIGSVPVIGVPGLRDRAGELAARFFGQPGQALRVVAVTGTNGKTSTTWFLRDAFQALGYESALLGTLGARCGQQVFDTDHTTPDVISLHRWLRRFRDDGAEVLVMEASSHALAQNRLDAVPVSTGVFTNLSHEHLDYHGDMDAYYRAKASLFRRRELELAAINADDAAGRRLLEELPSGPRVVRYGAGAGTELGCSDFRPDATGMTLCIRLGDEELTARVPLFGRFNADNLLAVAGVLHGLGYDTAAVRRALEAVTPVPGRMEPVDPGAQPRVLVDYAHTPDALEQALTSVRAHFSGRLLCVVGCGGERDRAKRPRMAAVAERHSDEVVFTADNPRGEALERILEAMLAGVANREAIRVEPDRRAAVRLAVARARPGDVVLIAGKGHEDGQEVAGKRIPMKDHELARAALAARGGVA